MGRAAIVGGTGTITSGGGSIPSSSSLGQFTIGAITAEWSTLALSSPSMAARHMEDVLTVTVPVTPPGTLGDIKGAHLYVENPDQSSGTALKLDGSTTLGSALPVGNWAPEDMGQQPFVSGTPFVIIVHGATPGQSIRVYVQAYTELLDATPVQAGHTGATPSATFIVPDFQPKKVGNGLEYEPLIALVGVTTLPDDWSTGKRKTPIVVKVDPTSLPNPVPDGWACEVVLVWDSDIAPDPNAGKNIATGAFGIDEIIANGNVLPAGQDGVTSPHTLMLDTPNGFQGLTLYVRSLKHMVSMTSARAGVPQTQSRYLRNTVVPGVTPSAHIFIGAFDGTVDIGAALTSSISSEFHIVTLPDGTKQIQMLALDMSKASHLSSQFVFDPALGVQKIAQLDAGLIITGFFQVGGGGNKVSQMKIFDTSNQLIGWVGDDSASTGAVGAWFKRLYIGGTSPLNAKIVADAFGNVSINGSLIVGPVSSASFASVAAIFNGTIQATQVVAGQFTGLTMVLNKNGITTSIDSLFAFGAGEYTGVRITNNFDGSFCGLMPRGLYTFNPGNLAYSFIGQSTSLPMGVVAVYYPNTGQSIDLNPALPGVNINGVRVLSTRVFSTPSTLADVISILQHHGLSN